MPNLLISQLVSATPALTDHVEFEPVGLSITRKTTWQGVKDLIGGGGGTVISVGLAVPTPTNPAFSVTGSPVTTSGTLTINANGTTSQYIDGTGALRTFPAASTITADSGLTMSTATNVQLGATSGLSTNQPLLHDTFINANTFSLIIGTATSEVLKVNSNTAGNVVTITNSGNGNGLFAVTQGGIALLGQSTYSSTAAVEEILRLNRLSSGTAANGIGAKLVFNVETSATTSKNSGNIVSTFTDVTDATRSASMRFEVTSAAVVLQRYCIFGSYTALTEGTATAFLRINVPTAQVTGGEILITVEANDATEYQSRTLRVIFTAVNKGGTTTVTLGTVEEVVAVSSGTLTVTITAVDAGSGNVDFKADATSSLTQTVLRAQGHLLKNFGSGTITSNN